MLRWTVGKQNLCPLVAHRVGSRRRRMSEVDERLTHATPSSKTRLIFPQTCHQSSLSTQKLHLTRSQVGGSYSIEFGIVLINLVVWYLFLVRPNYASNSTSELFYFSLVISSLLFDSLPSGAFFPAGCNRPELVWPSPFVVRLK